MKYKQKKTV